MAPQHQCEDVNGWQCVGIRKESNEWFVAGGNAVLLHVAEEGNAWDRVSVAYDVDLKGGHTWIDLDPWYILFNPDEGRFTVSRYVHGNIVESRDVVFEVGRMLSIGVEVERAACIVVVNGESHSFNADESELATRSVRVSFTNGVRFSMPVVNVRRVPKALALRPPSAPLPALEMTVDFCDDLLITPYDTAKLRQMFEQISAMGVKKTYWIHHGDKGSGFWDSFSIPGAIENFKRTFEALGNDYLPAAVQAAHQVGNELVAILKPFDTAICHITQSELADTKPEAVGGSLKWAFNFPRSHPELCMQRGSTSGEVKKDAPGIAAVAIHSRLGLSDISRDDVQVWVSEANARYRAVPFDLIQHESCIHVRLQNTDARYVLIRFLDRVAHLIRQTAVGIISAYDRQGNEVPCTPGLFCRRMQKEAYHLDRQWVRLDPVVHGINYDYAGDDIPSAVWNCESVRYRLHSPVKADGFIGVAAGVNTHVPAVLSEAMPGSHVWWLEQIDQMLASGADGVEIRVVNHGNILDWRMYGFNKPVIEAYHQRYGKIPTNDDRAGLQALRGDFFTDFLRAASARVRAVGRKFYLHIEDMYQGAANEPAPMGIHLPWRTWIDERLCDGVTLKPLNHWALSGGWAAEVMSACHAKGIPISFCPFIHSVYADPHRDQIVKDILSLPLQAFNLYEFATLYKCAPDGSMEGIGELPEWLATIFPRRR